MMEMFRPSMKQISRNKPPQGGFSIPVYNDIISIFVNYFIISLNMLKLKYSQIKIK